MKDRSEILSWNVNGISHVLHEKQRSIKRYFSKSERGTDDDEEGAGNKGEGDRGREGKGN